MNFSEVKYELFKTYPNLHIVHWKGTKPSFVEGKPENLSCSKCGGKFKETKDQQNFDYNRTIMTGWECPCGSKLPVESLPEKEET